MGVKLKEYFGIELARLLADRIATVHAGFASESFIDEVATGVPPLELKARVTLISSALRRHLPADYTEALSVLLDILGPENPREEGMFTEGYWLMPVAHFVEAFGLDHPHLSLDALYEITKRHTGEYALRPYVQRYGALTYAYLERWSTDPNPHVRRLVSEGIRPRLPWAKRLQIDDPAPVLSLLQRLRDDRSAYVRRSVANNLHDLVHDHRELVLGTLEVWGGVEAPKERLWVIRHALRNLIKEGDPRAIEIACPNGRRP